MDWKRENMGGWFRYTSGDFTIEKEDTRSYSVWYRKKEINNADSARQGKRMAQHYADIYGIRTPHNDT